MQSSSEESDEDPTTKTARRHRPPPINIEDIKEPTLSYNDDEVDTAMEQHLKKNHFLLPESVDTWKTSPATGLSHEVLTLQDIGAIFFLTDQGGRPKVVQPIRHKMSRAKLKGEPLVSLGKLQCNKHSYSSSYLTMRGLQTLHPKSHTSSMKKGSLNPCQRLILRLLSFKLGIFKNPGHQNKLM